jgi:hypothetical protein
MSNRRDFLKKLGFSALIPIVPKLPVEEAVSTAPTLLKGKIKTGGLLAHIEDNGTAFTTDGPERFRIYSNASMMKMYEDALWKGNTITDKNK